MAVTAAGAALRNSASRRCFADQGAYGRCLFLLLYTIGYTGYKRFHKDTPAGFRVDGGALSVQKGRKVTRRSLRMTRNYSTLVAGLMVCVRFVL